MFFNQPAFRWFQCLVDDDQDKSFSCSGNYIQQGEPNSDILDRNTSYNDDEYYFSFFGREYDESIWFSDMDFHILCLLARKGTSQLEQAAIKADTSYPTTDYSLIRKRICELCLASRVLITRSGNEFYDLKTSISPSVKILLQSIKRLKQLPDYIIFNSTKLSENINLEASYNYLHLALDMYWLSLTSEHYIEDDLTVKLEVFEKNLNDILADLIHVSIRKFEKLNIYTNLSKHSPFLCSCFKELWLLIQMYIEKLKQQHFCKDFWHYFNNAIRNEINLKSCSNGKDAVACIWLLYHVARIQGYDSDGCYVGSHHHRVASNYPLIEQYLKIATNVNSSQTDEQLMSSCLHLLASLQMSWWKKDATFDLLQLLWEYFYKKLNMSFCDEPGNYINNSQKFYDYSILTETIIACDLELLAGSVSSYDIFLSLLGKYLTLNPSHWPKFKGRIYSKLSPPKLAALTDIGLHNLIQLFFVLAYTVNFKELTDKLQSLLGQLPPSKSEGSTVIWSAHISLLLMRVNRGMSLNGTSGSEICTPILLAVKSASGDRSQAHLMRIFIEGLKNLIESDRDLRCQEHLLFGGWISRYLQWCSHSDACFLLDILKILVEKIKSLGGHPDWWTVMENNVVSSIIQLSSISDSPCQVAELAATLISADGKQFKNLMEHMTGDSVSISLSIKFLTSLLELNGRVDFISDHQTLLLQAWIRIALLSTDKSALKALTALISRLPNWSSLGCAVSEDDDPLYVVIRSAGVRMQNSRSMQDTATLKRWFETYFGKMDRWAAAVISAAEKGESTQLVMRVYTAAAVLYLHCAPALYTKNKNTCILYRLTSTILLPASVLMNKRPSNIILTALKRTWHLFVRGIARLDHKTDMYVERTLKDMAIRYIPHMNDATSPIIRCLDNEFEDTASTFILDRIANTFISCKSKNCHEHSMSALKLVLEMSRKQCDNNKPQIFTKTVLPSLFEQLLFSEDATTKNIVVQIINTIKSNQYYFQIKEVIKSSLMSIIDKHLAFHSTNTFRFLEQIANVLPNEIEGIFTNLKEAVKKVECMRGVGYDNTLRKGLQRIQEIMNLQLR